jgi:mannose-6-phosphate isomerase-like protein (cupin superfamily)
MTTDPPMSAQPLWFIDNLVYVHVDGEQSSGAFSLSETWGPHGNMPPLHVHHRNDETFYVLEGELRCS